MVFQWEAALLSNQYVKARNDSSTPAGYKSDGKEIKRVMLVLLVIYFAISNASEAFAYVDPNTGGYVFQLVFPIISIIGFAYLFFKRQIKLLFAGISSFSKGIIKKTFSVLGIARNNIQKGSD
jgi:hypothetical protein